jgi:hypothetical protein
VDKAPKKGSEEAKLMAQKLLGTSGTGNPLSGKKESSGFKVPNFTDIPANSFFDENAYQPILDSFFQPMIDHLNTSIADIVPAVDEQKQQSVVVTTEELDKVPEDLRPKFEQMMSENASMKTQKEEQAQRDREKHTKSLKEIEELKAQLVAKAAAMEEQKQKAALYFDQLQRREEAILKKEAELLQTHESNKNSNRERSMTKHYQTRLQVLQDDTNKLTAYKDLLIAELKKQGFVFSCFLFVN